MPIIISCRCGKRLKASDDLAGNTVACPACGQPVTIAHSAAQPGVTQTPGKVRQKAAPSQSASQAGPAFAPAQFTAPTPAPQPEPPASKKGLIIGLSAGGVGVVAVVVVILIAMRGGDKPQAHAPEVLAQKSGDPGNPGGVPGQPPGPGTNPPGGGPGYTLPGNPGGPGGNNPPGNNPPGNNPPGNNPPMNPMGPQPMGPMPGTPGAGPANPTPPTPAVKPGSTPESRQPPRSLGATTLKWFAQDETPAGLTQWKDSLPKRASYSWLTQLLPYMGHDDLYGQLDFKKPPLIKPAMTLVPEFLNPAAPRKRYSGYPYRNFALTHFVGMSGVETSANDVAGRLPRSDPRAGIFGYDRVAKPSEITDGRSHTIMLIGADGISANPWILGGGATIRGAREPYLNPISGFSTAGLTPAGTMVLMADGTARSISTDVDPQVFRDMCTIHGSENVDLAPFPALPRFGDPGSR